MRNKTVLTQGPEGPAPVRDVVATIYESGSALYVEPLPPQSLDCLRPMGAVGCPVDRVWYGLANVTRQQEADAEWLYRGPDLSRNWVLVVGHLATVTVREGDDPVQPSRLTGSGLRDSNFQRKVVYNLVATICDDECVAEENAEKTIWRDRPGFNTSSNFSAETCSATI